MRTRVSLVAAIGLVFTAISPTPARAQPEPQPEAPPPATPPPTPVTPATPAPKTDAPATPPAAEAAPKPPPPSPSEISKPTSPGSTPAAPSNREAPNPPPTGFSFGSYGRMIAATDLRGQPGRDANIVAHGSRLDEGDYVELELRRDDYWKKTDSNTRLVVTLAVADPFFHYDGSFDAQIAVRNLYMEERDLIAKGLSVWAGSRMYRGDDIYLLDWWPLDNLNTLGAGARYDAPTKTSVALQVGVNQPATGFFKQIVPRQNVYNQPGALGVAVLNRQQAIGSLKIQQMVPLGNEGAGLKGVLYGEYHQIPAGQEQASRAGVFESLPADHGMVIGGQIGAFTGQRDTHVNLFVRYATGLAAYGELTAPYQLNNDKTSSGAHEFVAALGANYEIGPFGVMFGGYVRSFRDASAALDFQDIDEGILIARPAVFFGEIGGLAVEGSYQVQQRGVLTRIGADGQALKDPVGPLSAHLTRIGVVPFLSPAGRGDFSRPQFRLIYAASFRNAAAKSLYPVDDVASLRSVEHFLGIGAEWWFNSTSYGQ